MILFNLLCAQGHEFEGWFKNGAAFDGQCLAGEIDCPVCGDRAVRKAPMAPCVHTGRAAVAAPAAELREALLEIRRSVEENCTYVGNDFPDEVRRQHYGEAEERAVYGEASPDEVRQLTEEGVEVLPLPWIRRHDG